MWSMLQMRFFLYLELSNRIVLGVASTYVVETIARLFDSFNSFPSLFLSTHMVKQAEGPCQTSLGL